MKFFKNPPKRSKGKRAKRSRSRKKAAGVVKSVRSHKTGKFVSAKAWRASPFRRNPRGGSTMKKGKKKAVRRRRRSAAVSRRPTRRRYRRNPPILRGALRTIQQGVFDAGGVVIGKAVARIIPQTLKLEKEGTTGLLVQLGTAVGVGIIGDMLKLPRDFVRMLVAGGLAAPAESLVVSLNIPILSPALAGNGLGAYPRRLPGMGAYAEPPPTYVALPASGATTDVFGTDLYDDAEDQYELAAHY